MTPTLSRGQSFSWGLWTGFSYCHHCIAPSLCLRKFYSKVSGNSSVLSGPTKLIESAKEKIEQIGLENHAIPSGGNLFSESNSSYVPKNLNSNPVGNISQELPVANKSNVPTIYSLKSELVELKENNSLSVVSDDPSSPINSIKAKISSKNPDDSSNNLVVNLQIKLIGVDEFKTALKEIASTKSVDSEETHSVSPDVNTSYDESINKMRKKFLENTFSPPKSNNNHDKPKKYLRSVSADTKKQSVKSCSGDRVKPKRKMKLNPHDKRKNSPNSKGFLAEDENLILLEYVEEKKKTHAGNDKKKGNKPVGDEKNKFKNTAVSLNPQDILKEKELNDLPLSKLGELIDKYIEANFEELSHYYLDVISLPEKPNSSKNVPNIKKPGSVPVQKITTFPLTNTRKRINYERPKEGILNIDLFANPLLKEKFSNFPSVSKILNETMSETAKQALENWKIRMINLMGKEEFESFNQEQLNRGKEFHGLIKDAVMGKEVKIPEESASSRCFKSIEWILKDISEVAAVESFVAHPHLAYKGIFDCVAKYKGKPVLIEWKHSTKAKHSIHSTYDAPIQLSAYLGALNYDKNYNFRVEGGMVVVAHTDGSPADLFDLPLTECSRFWTLWLERLTKFATTTKL